MIFCQDPREQPEADLLEWDLSFLISRTKDHRQRRILANTAVRLEEERFGPQVRMKENE